MHNDEYLYGHISEEYKDIQTELALYKICQAESLCKSLCRAEPSDRDVVRILESREAIKFWRKSLDW